jgi:hypothetical protein
MIGFQINATGSIYQNRRHRDGGPKQGLNRVLSAGNERGRKSLQLDFAFRFAWRLAPAILRIPIMPSLFRFLIFVGLIGAIAYGAVFSLATFVQYKPREISVTIPQDKFLKPQR